MHAEGLLRRLEAIEHHNGPADMAHMQHMENATRVRELADHLRAALSLSETCRYASALVVIRAALEHHLLDRLIFLGTRHIVIYPKAKKRDRAKWDADLRAARASPESDIATWFWDDRNHLNVAHRGYHSVKGRKGRGRLLSSYYFAIDNYDPFVGPTKHATKLAAPFFERDHVVRWAEEASSAWFHMFRHNAVMKALSVNRLLPGQHVQVEVHYSFLSAFAHPSKKGYQAIYGMNSPNRMGSFDHYASELVLLYVIVLAAAEIETWGRMARRDPVLPLVGWDDVMIEVRDAQIDTSYFWFLSGAPELYDRIETVHTPVGNRRPKVGAPKVAPVALPPSRVKYHRDPLKRLVELHASFTEFTTGLTYRSPFERPDARMRH
jgi:hypothetical protein